MKIILSSIAALALLAGTAQAHHTQSVEATISRVDPIYNNQQQHVPSQVCEQIQVPIYSTVQGPGATGSDVLGGMILGGLLGKGVTGDDKGAAIELSLVVLLKLINKAQEKLSQDININNNVEQFIILLVNKS